MFFKKIKTDVCIASHEFIIKHILLHNFKCQQQKEFAQGTTNDSKVIPTNTDFSKKQCLLRIQGAWHILPNQSGAIKSRFQESLKSQTIKGIHLKWVSSYVPDQTEAIKSRF